MATPGFVGDVNNSLIMEAGYPVGRAFGSIPAPATSFDVKNNFVSELGALNQDFKGMYATNASGVSTRNVGGMASGASSAGTDKQPAMWFIVFAVIFVLIAWTAHKFAPEGEHFAIIKPNLINGVFLTLWIVLILVLLKQVALRVLPIPGVSALAKLVLSA